MQTFPIYSYITVLLLRLPHKCCATTILPILPPLVVPRARKPQLFTFRKPLRAHMHDLACDGMIRFGRNSIVFHNFFTKEVDYHRPPLQIIFYSDLRHQEQGRGSQVRWPWVRSISTSLVTMSCIQQLSWVVMHYNSWCIACSHHLLFLLLQPRLILYEAGLSYCWGCIVMYRVM